MLKMLTYLVTAIGGLYAAAAWWSSGDSTFYYNWTSYPFLLSALLPFGVLVWHVGSRKAGSRPYPLAVALLTCGIAYFYYDVFFMPASADCGGLPCHEARNAFLFVIAGSLQLLVIGVFVGVSVLIRRHPATDFSGRTQARVTAPDRQGSPNRPPQ